MNEGRILLPKDVAVNPTALYEQGGRTQALLIGQQEAKKHPQYDDEVDFLWYIAIGAAAENDHYNLVSDNL